MLEEGRNSSSELEAHLIVKVPEFNETVIISWSVLKIVLSQTIQETFDIIAK